MLVTVVVPTYNRPKLLAEALKSILKQTHKSLEIVVVNDAGGSVRDVIARLNGNGRIIYIEHDRNKGLAAARNSGVKAAKGEYIVYLDDDDVFYSDHVETLVTFLEDSKYSVAYTDAYRVRGKKRDVPYSFDFDYGRILVHNFVPVLCFMHKKSCLREVGYFDEALTIYEDWDLWARMSRKFAFAHIKKITAEFREGGDGSLLMGAGLSDHLRAMEIIYKKNYKYTKDRPGILEEQKHRLRGLRSRVVMEEWLRCNVQSVEGQV